MYRPIGLAPLATPTIAAGTGSSYADRRRAAAERLLLAESLSTRLEAAVCTDPAARDGAPIDADGTLRACVRALVPLAHRTPSFEALVSLGPDHEWAARVAHGPNGPSVELVRGPGRAVVAVAVAHEPTAPENQIASELAALLWTGVLTER